MENLPLVVDYSDIGATLESSHFMNDSSIVCPEDCPALQPGIREVLCSPNCPVTGFLLKEVNPNIVSSVEEINLKLRGGGVRCSVVDLNEVREVFSH